MSDRDLNYFTDPDSLNLGDDKAPLRPSSKEARELLQAFADRRTSGHWHHISRRSLFESIRARVAFPENTFQADTALCGVVAMTRIWAQDFPVNFAKFAIDVFEKGHGWMVGKDPQRGRRIQPSTALRSSAVPPGMEPVDWLVAASIRESLNHVFDYTPGEGIFAIKGFTMPYDVVTQFRALGFTQIRNKVTIGKTHGYESLQEASLLYRSNWRVIMLIHDALIRINPDTYIPDQKKAYHAVPYPNHWIGLAAPISLCLQPGEPKLYPFKVWSNGTMHNEVSAAGAPIAMSQVINNYFGFIAGRF
ncbi:MAG: hypothetical protein RL701_3367 [Pseudomonadota bacterium]